MEPRWLDWARRLQAIAQNGLTYIDDPYDLERYEQVRHIAAEMMAAGAGSEIEPVLELFARESGYATPKVDVRGCVFDGDRLLLVKERSDGRWTLPGGWADVGESPAASTVREVWEESGYVVRATRLLAVYDRALHAHTPPYPYHIYKLFFLCSLDGAAVDGPPPADHEVSHVGFFPEDAIPELSISRVTPEQIRRIFAHHRHPEWPTDFD
jgi:ADP-ribose pyrophosphatase YjhB (NUDIX family)